jgi:hypothetical protein
MLERAGTFGMPIDLDESARWLVQHYVTPLKSVQAVDSTQPVQAMPSVE